MHYNNRKGERVRAKKNAVQILNIYVALYFGNNNNKNRRRKI